MPHTVNDTVQMPCSSRHDLALRRSCVRSTFRYWEMSVDGVVTSLRSDMFLNANSRVCCCVTLVG